jgi:uncharacterized NAD(P)/FAD-binding protein YdhS
MSAMARKETSVGRGLRGIDAVISPERVGSYIEIVVFSRTRKPLVSHTVLGR